MNKTIVFICILIMCLLMGCKHDGPALAKPQRAVYYWRTSFVLSGAEKEFLKKHEVGRMYVRLFDVVAGDEGPMPNRTITFRDDVPKGVEVVPVVFLEEGLFNDERSALPQMLVERVEQIMTQHDLRWKELQVDFDWTVCNQENYFAFLESVRAELGKRGKGLSATIRLHQLAMTPPPVDYGALMVYNIGKYADKEEPNSILTKENLQPYLPYLSDYDLPLATALPLYAWDLAFHCGEFQGIAHGVDGGDTTLYKPLREEGRREYIVVRYHIVDNSPVTDMGSLHLYPGDVIRHEECSADVLMEARRLLHAERKNVVEQVILYHLDEENIKRYKYEDVETLYSGY